MPTPRLFLLDAMALIYRAHFVFVNNPRVTSTGLDTSAVYGFTNTLLEVLDKERPTHLAVAFESEAPTFRHLKDETYKANRPPAPAPLIAAIPMIQKLLEGFGIPSVSVEGYEADDVMGTLAVEAAAADYQVFLMTPDKDFAQLVNERISLYRPGLAGKPHEILGPKEVKEKYGVPPEQIADLLGLKGDASDNIPGIPKVGDKTAIQLIEQFGSLENVIARANEITKPALRESIKAFAEQGIFSKHMATIDIAVPIPFDPEAFAISEPNYPMLELMFQELEFRTIGQRLQRIGIGKPRFTPPTPQGELAFDREAIVTPHTGAYHTILDTPHTYLFCESETEIKELVANLKKQTCFCFDTETTSLDPMEADIVGLSIAMESGTAYYIPFPEQFSEAKARLSLFTDIFTDKSIVKIAQNIKYDLGVLRRYGIEVSTPHFDTMLAHYLIQAEGKHNMDALARQYLQYEPVPLEQLIGKKGKNQLPVRAVPLDQMKDYAAEDADITLQLYDKLNPELDKYEVRNLFNTIEMPLVPVLLDMEWEGVKIDMDFLQDYSIELDKELQQLEIKVYELSGEKFNLNSPKQLGEILFDKLKLGNKPKKTPTGQYATDEDTLTYLAAEHELPAQLLEYRQMTKLKSTYVDALPLLRSKQTGRVHTSFNQAVAITGRLSSNNPNLQNIPIRTDRGREVRKAFVPRDADHILLSADYSQIELRIMAHLSNDEGMRAAFANQEDIHNATAARIFGVPQAEVTGEMRRKAKMANFGIIYGITPFGLASRLKIDRKEAGSIIDGYFNAYSGVKAFMNQCVEHARSEGFVRTLSGRRHYLPNINSGNPTVRGFAERNAINTPIQGTAADLIKLAMIRLQDKMKEKGFAAKMILQVHDELLFDVPRTEVEQLKPVVLEAMQNAMTLSVPLEVSIGVGENWLDAH